jgi:hypothetical protein
MQERPVEPGVRNGKVGFMNLARISYLHFMLAVIKPNRPVILANLMNYNKFMTHRYKV